MAQLTLTDEEIAALKRVLDNQLHDMDWEVVRTDQRDYRAWLKHDEALLHGIRRRLDEIRPPDEQPQPDLMGG